MKSIYTIVFLSVVFFVVSYLLGKVGVWNQSINGIAVMSLIFGVLVYAVGAAYLRRKRPNS
jgi:uncharacterized membrane protein YagU involved in acid resistance